MSEGGITGKGFVKGRSGNPTGRPKVVGEIKDLARQYGPGAIAKLAEMSGLVANHPGAENESARIAAIRELLDRGYGKAAQPISGADGGPITIITGVRRELEEMPQVVVTTGIQRGLNGGSHGGD